jgi:hypothetical protein
VLSDSASGPATTSEGPKPGWPSSNTSVLDKSAVKGSSDKQATEGLLLARGHGDGGPDTASENTERDSCTAAQEARAGTQAMGGGLAAGCSMRAGVEETAGSCGLPRRGRMERHWVVAALLKCAQGRPWLPHVLADAQASLDALVALHAHIVESERQRLVAAVDASPSLRAGAAAAKDASPHDFIKSDEYLGVRRGMLFREGRCGLGYYPWPCADTQAASREHLRLPATAGVEQSRDSARQAGGLALPSPPAAGGTQVQGGRVLASAHGNPIAASAHGNAHRAAKVAVLEMVDDEEAGQWELDARFVGQERALHSRQAQHKSMTGTHGPSKPAQRQQATETDSAAAGDAGTDRRGGQAFAQRAPGSDSDEDMRCERDGRSGVLDGAAWHDKLARQMDLEGAARAAAMRQHQDSRPLRKVEPHFAPHENWALDGRRGPVYPDPARCAAQQDAADVDPLLATKGWQQRGNDDALGWQDMCRVNAMDARIRSSPLGRGQEDAGACMGRAGGENPGLDDRDTTVAPKDGFELDVADESVEDMLVQGSQGIPTAPCGVVLRLHPPPGGWRDDDPNILRISLEEEEESSGEGSAGGRVWMSPEEIAQAHGQRPPHHFDDLPTQVVLFNSTEIIAQSKRDTCPCRWHPSECMACRGVPRVMFPESDVDESWPEITRHEFRKRFPHVAEPTWPADEGVYVPDSDLVWWTPWLSA